MNNLRKLRKLTINVLAAIVFGVMLVMPLVAQEATPEVQPVMVVIEAPVAAPDASAVTLATWQLFAVIIGSVLSGGALSIVGLGMLADKIRNDPVSLKNAESVGNSVPAATADKLIAGIDSMVKVLALFKEALDRVPAETKTEVSE